MLAAVEGDGEADEIHGDASGFEELLNEGGPAQATRQKTRVGV